MIKEVGHFSVETDSGQIPISTSYLFVTLRAHLKLVAAVTSLLAVGDGTDSKDVYNSSLVSSLPGG